MKILIVGPSWVGDSVISQSLFKKIFSIHQEICIDVLAPEWTIDIYQRMEEVNHAYKNPFNHGEIKIGERNHNKVKNSTLILLSKGTYT